jgi:chorismate mutase / prephenate dehydratase
MHTPLKDTDLSILRTEIDKIDMAIIGLLKERLHIVHQVGKIKAMGPKQSFIRPAREATMIKNLIEQADKQYPAETISRIWRSIISASLYAEQPFYLAVETPHNAHDNYWLAREYFASFIPTFLLTTASEVIHHIQNDPSFVGIVSPSGNWWNILSTGIGAPYGIQVFARLPMINVHSGPNHNPVLALAQVTPERTGEDISLLVAHTASAEGLPALQQALTKLALPLLHYQKDGDKLLLSIDGYISSTTPDLLDSLQKMTSKYISNILPMGCYARQIDV